MESVREEKKKTSVLVLAHIYYHVHSGSFSSFVMCGLGRTGSVLVLEDMVASARSIEPLAT